MKSLQDQLLNAGLVDKNKAKQVTKEKKKSTRAARKKKGGNPAAPENPGNAMSARHARRDRELNQQRQRENEKKAVAAQIKQLVTTNRVDPGPEQVSYNFVYQNKIKTLGISEATRDQILHNRLLIVAVEEGKFTRFELVPPATASKIAERDDSVVIAPAQGGDDAGGEAGEEDPYAGYEVPDDLIW